MSRHVPASAEAVELFLEEELFIDIRIELTPGDSSTRRWVEGFIEKVNGREILVSFLDQSRPNETLNVDSDIDRLAELHSRTSQIHSIADGSINNSDSNNNNNSNHHNNSQYDNELNLNNLYFDTIKQSKLDFNMEFNEIHKQFIQKWFPSNNNNNSSSSSSNSSSAAPVVSTDIIIDDTSDLPAVHSSSFRIPLFDSLSHCRISVPVRSIHCSHIACFDLLTHIEHNKNSILWNCELCKKEALQNDLIIDPFILCILQAIQFNCNNNNNNTVNNKNNNQLLPSSYKLNEELLIPILNEIPEDRTIFIDHHGNWKIESRNNNKYKNNKRFNNNNYSNNNNHMNNSMSSNNKRKLECISENKDINESMDNNNNNNSNISTDDIKESINNNNNNNNNCSEFDLPYPIIDYNGNDHIDLTEFDEIHPDILLWISTRNIKIKSEKSNNSSKQSHTIPLPIQIKNTNNNSNSNTNVNNNNNSTIRARPFQSKSDNNNNNSSSIEFNPENYQFSSEEDDENNTKNNNKKKKDAKNKTARVRKSRSKKIQKISNEENSNNSLPIPLPSTISSSMSYSSASASIPNNSSLSAPLLSSSSSAATIIPAAQSHSNVSSYPSPAVITSSTPIVAVNSYLYSTNGPPMIIPPSKLPLLDINHCSITELHLSTGFPLDRCKEIIKYRKSKENHQIESMKELNKNIKGIGPVAIKKLISVCVPL